MKNLLLETLDVLGCNNVTPSDVLWCGIDDYYFTWQDFAGKLADFEYDNGYGGVNLATSIVIVGKDFWLERHEYDGAEWWEFKMLPVKPTTYKVPKTLKYGVE